VRSGGGGGGGRRLGYAHRVCVCLAQALLSPHIKGLTRPPLCVCAATRRRALSNASRSKETRGVPSLRAAFEWCVEGD
jgi:hypothetical protein